MMKAINKNIVQAAVLQELAQPYSLIYFDTANRNLYFAVCTSSPNEIISPSFSAVKTSPREIENYMNEKLSLHDIFLNKKTLGFKVIDNNIVVNDDDVFCPDQTFNAMKWFDPEFCEEEVWIETFLSRYTKGDNFEII